MTENLVDFAQQLRSPENYWEQAVTVAAADDDGLCTLFDPLPEAKHFSMFRQNDGAGNEAVLLIRRQESGSIDAALMLTYDHESPFAANITRPEEAGKQPALEGFPLSEFAPAFYEGSPLFWDYKEYPVTHDHVFASSAVWFLNGKWIHAEVGKINDFKGNAIDDSRMVRQMKSLLKEFQL